MVKKLLENNTLTQEQAEVLDTDIMGMVTPLRNDLKVLRDEKNTLTESFKGAENALEALKGKTADIDTKIAEAKEAGKAELVTVLNAERDKNEKLVGDLDSMSKANSKLTIDSAVSNALGKFDVKAGDKEMVQFYLRSKAVMSDDGTVKYQDGQNVTDLSEAFTTYFGANESRLNPQGDGGGSGATSGGKGGQNSKSRDDFEKLNPQAKAKFMADGGKLT